MFWQNIQQKGRFARRRKRWRNRHQVLFNHLLLDLFFLLRRYVGSSIGTHPGLFLLLAPCLEHGRRNLALRFAQTDVNQIVPKHGALFYLGIQQTTSRCPANLRLILDLSQAACTIGVQQINIVLRQLLREYKQCNWKSSTLKRHNIHPVISSFFLNFRYGNIYHNRLIYNSSTCLKLHYLQRKLSWKLKQQSCYGKSNEVAHVTIEKALSFAFFFLFQTQFPLK